MKRAIAFFLAFILIAGCLGQEQKEQYSIDSLAIESQAHVFSKQYKIFVKLGDGAFNSSNALSLYQNELKIAEYPLNSTEVPAGNQALFTWPATSVGNYEIKAVIEDANGTEVSNSKTLQVLVLPLGFYELGNWEANRPVETEVWCAQQFAFGHEVPVAEIGLHLRSMVSTREGKTVSVEIVNDTGGLPGGSEIASASIASTSVPSAAEWILFDFGGAEIPAGTYWLVLKRDDTVGNIAWTYSEGETGNAFCRDMADSGEWEQIDGSFAFQIK